LTTPRTPKTPAERGLSNIGAPGFEPGTSPTRTARATRLRHAPTQTAVSHTARRDSYETVSTSADANPSGYARPMPCQLQDAIAELDRLLQPGRFKDYCPNGLQFPGKAEIKKLATGVSAGVELFERAIAERADLLVVHHGLFWGTMATPVDLRMKRRLKLLFDSDMSLAAYHLPLDAHPQVGNNALIARGLGADKLDAFALHDGEPIGFVARFPGDGLAAEDLFARVANLTQRTPLVFDAGPKQVRSIAIVSGAGNDYLQDAITIGVDAFLTGEPAERVMGEAREAAIHFIAAGHYATETFGVRRLGEHLSERFALEHMFIDVPNPI
jgi:dinuclear metal center YbgI/SA1388 family protein